MDKQIKGLLYLVKNLRRLHRDYGIRLKFFQRKSNLFRLQFFTLALISGLLISLFLLQLEGQNLRRSFVGMIVYSGLVFAESLYLSSDKKRSHSVLTGALVNVSVTIFVLWSVSFLYLDSGFTEGVFIYVLVLLAVATIFSLDPFYFFLLCSASLLLMYLPRLISIESVTIVRDEHLLGSSLVMLFAWFVAFFHHLSTVELFLIRERQQENKGMAELALKSGNLGYWNWDMEKDKIYVDERWLSLLGYTEHKGQTLRFADFFHMIAPEDRSTIASQLERHIGENREIYTARFRMITRDQKRKWILAKGKVTHWDQAGNPLYMHGIHQDIQEMQDQQRKLEESEARFKAYTEHSPVAILLVHNFRIQYVNQQALRLSSYAPEDLLNRSVLRIVHKEEHRSTIQHVREIISNKSVDSEYISRIVDKKGIVHWVEVRVSLLQDDLDTYLLSLVDITDKKLAEERLKEFATYDELTGVYNRRVGMALIEQEMLEVEREGQSFCVCFLDVNGLKDVNDNYGHDEGDQLITHVVSIVQKELRRGDVLCRLGGDEFLLVFKKCSLENAQLIWKRIDKKFKRFNRTERKPYTVSVSHGIAEYDPASGTSVQQLINEADQKMYNEKKWKKAAAFPLEKAQEVEAT